MPLRPPTFRKGQVLHASDLNAMSAAVSSITGHSYALSSERGRLNSQQPVPRGLLSGVAMVTKFDPQGCAPKDTVMAVRPVIAQSVNCAPEIGCGTVVELDATLHCANLIALKVSLDRFGRPNCCVQYVEPDSRFRFTPWKYDCQCSGQILLPVARRVVNCVVKLCGNETHRYYRDSFRNLTPINVPVLPQNAPRCAPGLDGLLPEEQPMLCNSNNLLVPLPDSNTIVARRIAGMAGTSVIAYGCLCSPHLKHKGAWLAIKSGVQFRNFNCIGDGASSNWYCSCKAELFDYPYTQPLCPCLNKWQRVAAVSLRVPTAIPKYRNDDEEEGVICYVTYKKIRKTLALEVWQQCPHVLQLRFSPQNLDFSS